MIPELEEDLEAVHTEKGVEIRQKPSMRDNIRMNSRFLRNAVIGAAVLLTVLGGMFFWSRSDSRPLPPSAVSEAPTINELPGTGDAVYQEHLAAADRRRANEAQTTGGSAVSTPPVVRSSALTELQQRNNQQTTVQAQSVSQQQQEKPDNSNMTKAIADIVAARRQPTLAVMRADEKTVASSIQQRAAEPSAVPPQSRAPLVAAGRVLYGRTTIMATTEAPGPVLAEVLSEPLLGATLIGAFQATDNGMVISFNQITLPGQSPKTISALAVDPATTSYNVADDVDRRLWSRLVLPAAAAFVSGLGAALSQPRVGLTVGSSYVVTERSESTTQQSVAAGLGTAAGSVAQMLQQGAANARPIVTTNANREIGILFLTPIEATK